MVKRNDLHTPLDGQRPFSIIYLSSDTFFFNELALLLLTNRQTATNFRQVAHPGDVFY